MTTSPAGTDLAARVADATVNRWNEGGRMPPLAWDFRGLVADGIRSALALAAYTDPPDMKTLLCTYGIGPQGEQHIRALMAAAAEAAEAKAAALERRLKAMLPLFEEARDALPAIPLASAKLRGIDLTLADRMDAVGDPERWAEREAALAAHDANEGSNEGSRHRIEGSAAHDAQPQEAQPVAPGFKLVPVEPTPEMLAVGGTHCGTGMLGSPGEARKVYESMLAAAPAQPAGDEYRRAALDCAAACDKLNAASEPKSFAFERAADACRAIAARGAQGDGNG